MESNGAAAGAEVEVGVAGTRYGNWLPGTAIGVAAFFALLTGVLAVIAATVVPSTALLAFYVVLCVICVALLVWFAAIRHAYSYAGGKLMAKAHANLLQHLQPGCQGSVLDVGCGSGALAVAAAKACPDAQVTGVDPFDAGAPATAAQCEANAQAEGVAAQCTFVQGDLAALPFDDGSFDVVVGNLAYHALPQKDKTALVLESLRVLKPGGTFALQDAFDAKRTFGSPEELVAALQQAGVSEVHYEGGVAARGLLPRYVLLPLGIRRLGVLWGVK